jgi:hypothetical protein
MTKQIKLSIISIVILVIWFIALVIADSKKSDSDSKQIAEYEYQMNELRKAKEQCYDNLNYEESKQSALWFTKPCVQRDEQIMELREKADWLKAKSYEKGLDVSRQAQ